MKFPFILMEDGMVVVHDHDSGDVIEGYEGIAVSHNGGFNSYYLLGFDGSERSMAHLGFSKEAAIANLSKIAIGAMK